MSINKVMLTGNLTRDAEVRRTQSGMAIASFGIAVNDRRQNQQTGEWEDYPNFVDCTMFGARAEKIAGYLTKGLKAAIEGKLRYSSWECDGQKRSKLEVIVDEIEFMSARQGNQGGAQGGYGQQAGGYAYGSGNAPQAAPQQPQGGYGYGQPQPAPQQQGGYQQQPMPMPAASASVYDEDIPF